MVDDHGVAGVVQVFRQYDSSRIRRFDRRARGTQKIGTAMRVARLSVEDAACTERRVRRLGNRTHERRTPQSLGGRRLPDRLLLFRFRGNARLRIRRRIHKTFVHREPARRKLFCHHRDHVRRFDRSGGRRRGDDDRVLADSDIEVDADKYLPAARIAPVDDISRDVGAERPRVHGGERRLGRDCQHNEFAGLHRS